MTRSSILPVLFRQKLMQVKTDTDSASNDLVNRMTWLSFYHSEQVGMIAKNLMILCLKRIYDKYRH